MISPKLRTPLLAAAAALAVILSTVSGCARDPSRTVVIRVVDVHTDRPLSGARLVVTSLNRDHPMAIDSILGQTGAEITEARTDDSGSATIRIRDRRALRLLVYRTDGRITGVFVPRVGEQGDPRIALRDLPVRSFTEDGLVVSIAGH